jgi:hypothetical protein
MNLKKLISAFFILILIVAVVFFALSIISWIVFWGILILGAIYAYKVLPRLRK